MCLCKEEWIGLGIIDAKSREEKTKKSEERLFSLVRIFLTRHICFWHGFVT